MGVEAAAHTHPPATQDSTETVHNSRRCNQQSEPERNFGQVQTHKAPPEALAIFIGQQGTMTNKRDKYPLQYQMTKVAPEALIFFRIGRLPCGTMLCSAEYKNTIKR
jgi:hypothetical protein